MAGEPTNWKVWSREEECNMSVEPEVSFMKKNGMAAFEYYKSHPKKAQSFNDGMTLCLRVELKTIMLYFVDTWKEMERAGATVADNRGGQRLVMRKVKEQYPELKCKVVDRKKGLTV